MNLRGRVAIVTGGNREIGRAITTALAKEGTSVVICFLNDKGMAAETLKIVENGGGKGVICRVDVTRSRDVDGMVREVMDRFGRIDILVNNARAYIQRRDFSDTDWDDFQRHIDVTLKGIFNCCKAAITSMKEQRYGRIINILSSLTDDPVRGYSSYISALSAIIGFSKSLALELGEYGITVNNISPGFTVTAHTPYTSTDVKNRIAKMTPLKRLALPDDIAKSVLFYASNLSDFITGDNMIVDGGVVM
ncbi:MAG: SDR family NAD(P)-dependent oxidoreductase [Nitrospirota bacterium]